MRLLVPTKYRNSILNNCSGLWTVNISLMIVLCHYRHSCYRHFYRGLVVPMNHRGHLVFLLFFSVVMNRTEFPFSSFLWYTRVFLPVWLPEATGLSVSVCVLGSAAGRPQGLSTRLAWAVFRTGQPEEVHMRTKSAVSNAQAEVDGLLVTWWPFRLSICSNSSLSHCIILYSSPS